jgi:succinate dehydrogenase/fumarate reductase-like Fe-S protein
VFADMPEKFVGPLGLLWLAQMSLDPKSEEAVWQYAGPALDLCTRCGICSAVCPCSEKILDLALDTLERE